MGPIILNRGAKVIPVADQAARYALAAGQARVGDYIEQEDADHIYLVLDTAHLDAPRGYMDLGQYPQVPIDTVLPAISGGTNVGNTLTAGNGTWLGSPTGYTYQWLRCDAGGNNPVPISGATSQTYVLVSADTGSTIRVAVLAANDYGPAESAANSNATAVITASSFPLSGLVAYYKLGEAGGTRADSSGNGYDLTETNTAGQTIGIPGGNGFAASFDGTSYLSNSEFSFAGMTACTIAGWIKFTSLSGYPGVLSNNGSDIQMWSDDPDGQRIGANLGVGSQIDTPMPPDIVTGTWYFVCITWDGTTINFSINNGTPASQSASGSISAAAGLALGYRSNWETLMLGDLAEFGIWNYALSSDDQSILWNGGNGTTKP